MRTRGWLLLSTTAVAAAATAGKGGPSSRRGGRAPPPGAPSKPAAAASEGGPLEPPPPKAPALALVDEYLPRVLEDIQRLDAELDRELAGLFGGGFDGDDGFDVEGGGVATGPAPTPAQQQAQAAAAHKAISDVRGGGGLLARQLEWDGDEEEEQAEEEEDELEQQQRAWEAQSRLMAEMAEEIMERMERAEEEEEEEDGKEEVGDGSSSGISLSKYRLQEEEEEEEEQDQQEEGFLFMASTERIYEAPSARSKRRRRAAAAAAAATAASKGQPSLLSFEDDEEEDEEDGGLVVEGRRRKESKRARRARRAAQAEKKRRRRERQARKQAHAAAAAATARIEEDEEEEEEEDEEEEEEVVVRPSNAGAAVGKASGALLPPLGVLGSGATAASAFGWACLAVRLLQKEGGLRSALHYIIHPFHAVGSLTLPPAVAFAQAGRAHLRLLKHQPLHHQLGPFHRTLLRAAVTLSAVYSAVGLGLMSQARPLAALVAVLAIGLLQAAPHVPFQQPESGDATTARRSPLALGAGGLLWALLTVALPFSLTDTPAPLSLLWAVGADAAVPAPHQGRTLRRVACLATAAGLGQMAAACFRDAQALEGGLVTGGRRRAAARAAKLLAVASAATLLGAGMGPLVVGAAAAHAGLLAWLLAHGADGSLARGLAEVGGVGVLAVLLVGEAGLLFPQAQTEGQFARAVQELLRVGKEGAAAGAPAAAVDEAPEVDVASVAVPGAGLVEEAVGSVEAEPEAPRAPDAPPKSQQPLKQPLETYLG